MILTEELFQTEVDYAAAVLLSREMLQAGVIDAEDFARINRLHAERYQPIFLQETRQK
jgi:hypothetical protein